jgi:hypothetical protein
VGSLNVFDGRLNLATALYGLKNIKEKHMLDYTIVYIDLNNLCA